MERYQQVEFEAKTLVDPRFEHDSCGVGLVATLTALPSHQIVIHSLTALARLTHRGAIAADGQSSDGVGIMTGIPRELLLAQTSVQLPASQPLGVGVIFYSATDDAAAIEGELESSVSSEQFETLAWRDVPVDPQALGEIARASMPRIRQLLLTTSNHQDMERRLYVARKRFERNRVGGYVCSLSSRVLVYKALCAGRLLPSFYPDLHDARYTTAFAIFHQRYATNVMPAWERAQPLRMLAHNGEINTVWGNRARMDARALSIPLECHPLITPDGSDSTSLDEAVELIARNGRTLAEAVRMLLPPSPNAVRSAYMRYHSQTVEPWDGPAALAFSDGELVGAAMDRNGLRPCRYYVTEDGLVFAGSEAGLIDLDPKTIRRSERLGPGQMLLVDLAAKTFYDNEALNNIFDHATGYAELIEPGRLEPLHDHRSPRDAQELVNVQRGFGYTREDVKMVLAPMATDAKDAIWSMGDDTPIAPLSLTPRSVYAYFRQRFAQVTNPPIDPLREACVTSLSTRLGPWPHLLNKHAPLPGIELPSPCLTACFPLHRHSSMRSTIFARGHATWSSEGPLYCCSQIAERRALRCRSRWRWQRVRCTRRW